MSSWDTLLPGLGRLHTYCVGNTSHTMGIDHHFHAEGAEKPVPGYVRFRAVVGDEGQVTWAFVEARGSSHWKRDYREPAPTEQTQTDFPPEAVQAMRAFSERLDEVNPVSWVFSVMGAVDMELRDRLRSKDDALRMAEAMDTLLKDVKAPLEVYVDKATGHRPATEAEREERRAEWTRRRDRSRQRLAHFEQHHASRVAMLQAIRAAALRWCERTLTPTPPPKAYLAEAARNAQAVAA